MKKEKIKKRMSNFDRREEFLKKFKKLMIDYDVVYCGDMGSRPFFKFKDGSYYYFEFQDELLTISEYRAREI